jgi:hypothetical protein
MWRTDRQAEVRRVVVRLLAAAGLLAALGAGCGSESTPASETTTDKTYVVAAEPATLPKVLPSSVCFVGIHSYDVMLLGDRLQDENSCSRVAAEVFPGAEQLPWSRESYLRSDQVEECELERGGGTLAVLRGDPDQEGTRFEAAYDSTEHACARLEKDGWTITFQER